MSFILVIDNYDSFAHNLARYFRLHGETTQIVRNDAITVGEIHAESPKAIILSPGPCSPAEAGICKKAIQRFGRKIPILGVCLGHQCIGEVYGGTTIRAPYPFHGKASTITHQGSGLFENIPSPMRVGRYHSLISQIPDECDLSVTATSEDQIIMAMQHKHFPVYGVQFHPESILTDHGHILVQNFLKVAKQWYMQTSS